MNGLTFSIGRLTFRCAFEVAQLPGRRQRRHAAGPGPVAGSANAAESREPAPAEQAPAPVSFHEALNPGDAGPAEGTVHETLLARGRAATAPQPEQADTWTRRAQNPDPGFWDMLEPVEREALRSVASWRTFAAGARIMEEGERADHVMVILGGRAEIRIDENGSERVVAVRGLGQLVGERAALTIGVRSATVVALEMVWALVAQTKDFAAFISAHPRVLSIVQDQKYQRRAAGAPGYDYDDNSSENPPGPVSLAAATAPSENNYSAGYSRKRAKTLNGENCTVFLTDVVDFGARLRTDGDRLRIREALFKMTQHAMQGFPEAQSEDRGDGFLTVVPPNESTARVFEQLLRELPVALERHNSTHGESARFKLRLAVNVGPVVTHMDGVSGEAIIVAARLVEAPDFKEELAGSTASLGVIASPFVYETVVRHGSDPREVASYSQVPVEVKETDTTAWMRLFAAAPEPYGSYPGAPGSHAGH